MTDQNTGGREATSAEWAAQLFQGGFPSQAEVAAALDAAETRGYMLAVTMVEAASRRMLKNIDEQPVDAAGERAMRNAAVIALDMMSKGMRMYHGIKSALDASKQPGFELPPDHGRGPPTSKAPTG